MNMLSNFMNRLFPLQSKKLNKIQLMRALAAMLICASHIVHEIFAFSSSPLVLDFYFMPWSIGVDLFFIISGFIMMYTATDMFGQNGAPQHFAKRRLIRILPLYWFFTSLMVIATLLVPEELDTAIFSLKHAVLSFLFIPHIAPGDEVNIHPIMGIGWTLVYEMFFYTVFSISLFFKKHIALSFIGGLFAALFITAHLDLWTPALNLFWSNSIIFNFLLGIAIFMLLKKNKLHNKDLIIMVSSAIIFWAGSYLLGLHNERLFHYGMPALIMFCLLYRLPLSGSLLLGFVAIGDASYTLYLSHPFAVELIKQIFQKMPENLQNASWFLPLFIICAGLASVIGALIFYRLCEKPITKKINILLSR